MAPALLIASVLLPCLETWLYITKAPRRFRNVLLQLAPPPPFSPVNRRLILLLPAEQLEDSENVVVAAQVPNDETQPLLRK